VSLPPPCPHCPPHSRFFLLCFFVEFALGISSNTAYLVYERLKKAIEEVRGYTQTMRKGGAGLNARPPALPHPTPFSFPLLSPQVRKRNGGRMAIFYPPKPNVPLTVAPATVITMPHTDAQHKDASDAAAKPPPAPTSLWRVACGSRIELGDLSLAIALYCAFILGTCAILLPPPTAPNMPS
jgi:hypothetical protein